MCPLWSGTGHACAPSRHHLLGCGPTSPAPPPPPVIALNPSNHSLVYTTEERQGKEILYRGERVGRRKWECERSLTHGDSLAL